MSTDTQSSGGIVFCGLLTIVFITLKLTSVIAWSWWLVLLPLWGPITLVLAICLVMLVIAGVCTWITR